MDVINNNKNDDNDDYNTSLSLALGTLEYKRRQFDKRGIISGEQPAMFRELNRTNKGLSDLIRQEKRIDDVALSHENNAYMPDMSKSYDESSNGSLSLTAYNSLHQMNKLDKQNELISKLQNKIESRQEEIIADNLLKDIERAAYDESITEGDYTRYGEKLAKEFEEMSSEMDEINY